MATPEELFERWFVQPLRALRELPNGDGGIVALAVSCFLYERYAAAVQSESTERRDIRSQLAADFGVSEQAAAAFWAIVRNGLLHQGMPKQLDRGETLPQWLTTEGLRSPIELLQGVLMFQPWLFRDRVLDLWNRRPDLIAASRAFPMGQIFYPPE